MTKLPTPDEDDENLRERALSALLGSPTYRPMLQRELLHRVLVDGADRPAMRRLIQRWIRDGRLRRLRGGKLVLNAAAERGAERPPARGAEALGVFFDHGEGGLVRLLDPSAPSALRIPPDRKHGAAHLHAVRVRVLGGARGGVEPIAEILEDLGHLDEPGTDVRLVTGKYGLDGEFQGEALEAADGLPGTIDPVEAAARERFEDPPPVTIDGETARDFDDAIAVEELPRGRFRLFVHIADVAHFVPPGGALDREARRRGTSVYFPDRVLPMFPERLSDDLCSLRPGRDRLVQSVILDFTAGGKPSSVRFADGVIRSAARLTYTQVAALLDSDGAGHRVAARLVSMLRVADRLRQLLEGRRRARGSIDFDLPEPQILLDVEGVMTGITIEPRNRAHRMIEEFMLAANEAVAEHLRSHGRACVYRIHDAPDPVKLDSLARFVAGFGLNLSAREGTITPRDLQRALAPAEGRPESRVISQVALRSMRQASYSTETRGHFGLAAEAYCHFTSPIRRYPDLVVHRQLRAHRQRVAGPSGQEGDLEALARSCSELERNAEAAERELLSRKKVAFAENRLGEDFEGIVTGVTRFGLFVQVVENLVEGLVRVERLADEWLDYDESKFELVGSRTGKRFGLGQSMRVRIERVDRVLLRVDLEPVEDGSGRAAKRATPGGSNRRARTSRRSVPARSRGRNRRG